MNTEDFESIYNAYKNQNYQEANELSTGEINGIEEIVAVRKNGDGDLIAFKTNSGRELDYISALQAAKAGKIAHVDVFQKYGRDILRSEPDGTTENNLDNLPMF